MKYYLIAGEASGDIHGSHLIKAIQKLDPQAEFRCWGGDLMAAAGGTIVKHYRELAFMGFWEVFINIRTIFRNIAFCKSDIESFQPDRIIYIDYPGFNMRIAAWAKIKGFENHYYISPQIWAWKENRIKKIKRDLDALYVILPFEESYYRDKHQHKVHYVGHPLLDHLSPPPQQHLDIAVEKPIVALLPGSRQQEIERMLPLFLEVAKHFPELQFVVAAAPSLSPEYYKKFLSHTSIHWVHDQTYALLQQAHIAVVTSGTATLETALLNVPQLVCYRSSHLSYSIAKKLVDLPYISLVNLIADREVVQELIQGDCSLEGILVAIQELLDEENRKDILLAYAEIRSLLGSGTASQKTAQFIVEGA